MIALAKKTDSLNVGTGQEKPVARYLQLARKIHAIFTEREEKENAALRAAEAVVQRKNAVILQAVQEVTGFCQLLTQTPGLMENFSSRAKDIAERTLSNRYEYVVEDEPLAVQYSVPTFYVDMKAEDGTALSGAENAYLHMGLCPVRVAPSPEKPLDVPTMTTHTFFAKKYRIEIDGIFTEEVKGESKEADPIEDIITVIRTHVGRDYFEDVLLPYLEAQPVAPT